MKNTTILLIALAALSPLSGHAQPAPVQPSVQVSDSRSLASGFAQAFASLEKRGPVTIVTRRDGKLYFFLDVRKVEAVDGVLLITASDNKDRFIINPRDVQLITDGKFAEMKE